MPGYRAPFAPLELPRTALRRRRTPEPVVSLGVPPALALQLPVPALRPAVAVRVAPPRPAPSAPLRILHVPDVRSHYPPEALQHGLQGTVVVVLWIDAQGHVQHVTVERGSGHDLLDTAARGLAAAYRFSSGSGWRRTRLPVTFRIPERG